MHHTPRCHEHGGQRTLAVDGLEGATQEGPVLVIDDGLLIMVLQVRHSDEPEGEKQPAAAVEDEGLAQLPAGQVEHDVAPDGAAQGADDTASITAE